MDKKKLKKIIIAIFIVLLISVILLYWQVVKIQNSSISTNTSNNASNSVVTNDVNNEKIEEKKETNNSDSKKVFSIVEDLKPKITKNIETDLSIKLYEYDDSNKEYARIFYCISLKGHENSSLEDSYIKIEDEENNNLVIDERLREDDKIYIVSDWFESIKIKKIALDTVINFKIVEKMYGDDLENEYLYKIDLSKDLEEKEKIDQAEMFEKENLGDISFKKCTVEPSKIETNQSDVNEDFEQETIKFTLNSQYGNYLEKEGCIEIIKEPNINNLKLEDAAEKFYTISNAIYLNGFNLPDKISLKENTEKTFDLQELYEVAKGNTITKDDKDYEKTDFYLSSRKYKKMEDTTIGEGIKVKVFSASIEFKTPDFCYMFIYKNNIYYIYFPDNQNTEEGISIFLDSIQFN